MKSLFKKIIVAIVTLEAKIVLKKYKPKVIAITGNVGKTSTKDAVFEVLNQHFFVRKSTKSFNSELGVPLTILDVPTGWTNPFIWFTNILHGISLIIFRHPYPSWLVLEVGADKPGDIEKISKWLKTDIAIITRIGDVPVHIEFFKSVEHVVQEKAFLIDSLKKNGVLLLNEDDDRVRALSERTDRTVRTYGFSEDADYRAMKVRLRYENRVPTGLSFELRHDGEATALRLYNLVGKHHIYVALVAISVADHLKIPLHDIAASLENLMPPPGRLRLVEGLKGSVIIDDTYNASPAAVLSGLETMSRLDLKGKKIAILGDMLELGSYTKEAHKEVGTAVGATCDYLFTVGPRAQYMVEGALLGGISEKNIMEFDTSRETGKYVEGLLEKGDVVFVKGSQGMRMEKAVEEIMAHPENKKQVLVRQEKEWLER